MIVVSKNSFNKDIEKIKNVKLAKKLKESLVLIEKSNSLSEIRNVKKLKGPSNAYRLKINDYRLGFFIIKNVIELTIFMHRRDIYKHFP